MKYLKEFDYIIENMSQARKILKDNDIDKEDERFKKITDKTNRDGYTGFITKLVFEMAMDVDSALRLYDDLKEQSIDVGGGEIKNIMSSKVSNNKKIQEVIDIIRKKKNTNDYDLVFESNGYNVYQIHNYEGIMCTGSPAWCLKTKSMFDQYTKTKRGTQFVAIDKRDLQEDGTFGLAVPNTFKGDRYSNKDYRYIRYGITIFPSGKMEVFDDDNTQVHVNVKDGEVESSVTLPGFIVKLLNDLHKYWEENIKKDLPEGADIEGYDEFKEVLDTPVDEHRAWFSNMVARGDSEDKYNEFIVDVLDAFNVETKKDLFEIMNPFTDEILADSYFTANCGNLDILLNEFVSNSGEFQQLEEFPGITKREIPLSGYWYDEQETGDLVIKYHYGYQYDKYGKAALLQGFGSLKKYHGEIANNFMDIIDDDNYTAIGWLSNNFGESEDVIFGTNPKVTEYKDGYKITLDMDEFYKYKKEGLNKSKDEISSELISDLDPWFDGMKKEGNKIIIPICSHPTEKEDEES